MTWQSKKLGNIATFVNGKAFKPSDWSDSGLPIIRIQNLTNSIDDIHYYNGAIEDKYLIATGDILISWSATIGVFAWLNGDAVLNQHIFKVVFDKEPIDKTFFKHLIKQKIDEMLKNVHGSTMKHITKGDFDNIDVLLPSLDEQKKIAKILDKADEIRAKKKLANDKLDEFLKSTFISMFGDPKTNTKHLPIFKIMDLCIVQTGSTPKRDVEDYYKDATIPWVKTGEVVNQYICDSEEHISEKAIKETNCKLFPVNTILLAMYGQGLTRGRVGMLKIEASTNQACSAILPSDKINHEFLYNQLKIQYQTLRDYGRGGNQPNLNMDIVKNFEVICPPIDEQNKFAKIVEKVEEQKQKNEQVIEQMDNLFNSLSQRAFKGKLTKSNVVDLLTRQVVLHSKIIDKCNSNQTFGAVKLEKIFNLCDMIQELNLVPGGYYRKAAGPYVPEMRHSVEEKLAQNNWVKTINKGNGKKVEFKKCVKFNEYKKLYYEIFGDKDEKISKIINYFYDKDTDYCEAFSTLYMCWNDLILEGKNPTKTEIIDEFKNHWAPEKQRFERIYLLEILFDMSNQGFEPQGHGVHTIESNYNHNKDQLSLQLK